MADAIDRFERIAADVLPLAREVVGEDPRRRAVWHRASLLRTGAYAGLSTRPAQMIGGRVGVVTAASGSAITAGFATRPL